MAIQWVGRDIVCLSTDTKPTNVPVNTKAFETNTGVTYRFNGTAWIVESGGGGGGGGFSAGGAIFKSGTGSQTVFTIAHGLTSTPDVYFALPTNTAARGDISYSVDATNITLTYPIAPASGTNNLSYVWGAGYTNVALSTFTASSATTLSNKTIDAANNTLKIPYDFEYVVYQSAGTTYVREVLTGDIKLSNTDPSTVLQYAFTNAVNKGPVLIKKGTYTVNSLGDPAKTNSVLTLYSNTKIVGESMFNTKIEAGAAMSAKKLLMNNTQNMPGDDNIWLENLYLRHPTSVIGSGTAKTVLETIRASHVTLKNVYIKQDPGTRFGYFPQGGRDLTAAGTIKPIDYWAKHIRVMDCIFESDNACEWDSISGGIMENCVITRCLFVNGPGSSAGLAQRNTRYSVIDSCVSYGSGSAGFNLESGYMTTVSNCIAHDCAEDGFKALETDTGGLPTCMTFSNNKAFRCKKGIEIEGAYNTVIGNQCWENKQGGIDVSDTTNNIIAHNLCFNNGTDTGASTSNRAGIKTTLTPHATNYVDNNPGTTWVFDGTSSFAFAYIGNNFIFGNMCFDNRSSGKTQLYGIVEGGSTDNNFIYWNWLTGNSTAGMLRTGGASSKVRYNTGYVTEAEGATSVADGGTVTHGLATTPTVVTLTPSLANTIPGVTAKSTTTFTVSLKTDAGAAGTTQTVYWRATI
jgi:parallel beta-helix repeat protein